VGAAFNHLTANLDTYLKPTASTDARLVFQDYEKKYGVVTVAGRRLQVRLHLTKAPA
jgi:predicted metal-dependent hydrolase